MSNGLHNPGNSSKTPVEWYYGHRGERVGPISSQELKTLAETGCITRKTLIWKQGLKEWLPAGKAKGLFPEEIDSMLSTADVDTATARAQTLKPCSYCAEYIKAEAKKCRYCGELVSRESNIQCPACMHPSAADTVFCVNCGFDYRTEQRVDVTRSAPLTDLIQAQQASVKPLPSAPHRSGSGRNKLAAALLALFLGGIGIHKFYLGQWFQGMLYLFFCWTLIPAIIAFIEAIIYLVQSDESFERRYNR